MTDDGYVDLRSDTVTTPTEGMRRAMADAEVGDDCYGEDPTVNRLQELAAGMLGCEAALYVPTGTMANQMAVKVLSEPGGEVLCEQDCHLIHHESGASALLSQVQLRGLASERGVLEPAEVRRMLGAMALGAIKELLLQSVEARIHAAPRELSDEVMRFLAGGILTPGLPVEVVLARPAPRERAGTSAPIAYAEGE
jgi:threonine aldolase